MNNTWKECKREWKWREQTPQARSHAALQVFWILALLRFRPSSVLVVQQGMRSGKISFATHDSLLFSGIFPTVWGKEKTLSSKTVRFSEEIHSRRAVLLWQKTYYYFTSAHEGRLPESLIFLHFERRKCARKNSWKKKRIEVSERDFDFASMQGCKPRLKQILRLWWKLLFWYAYLIKVN